MEIDLYYAITGDGRVVLDGWYTVQELRTILAEAEAFTPRVDIDPLLS
jgi:hypothetical protein